MSVQNILEALDGEIANLTQARALLAGANGIGAKIAPANGKRVISASARRKMAVAQKKRWAAFHAAKGPAPKANLSIVPKRMSLAARKKIAAAQRARWAKLKAGNKKAA